MSETNKTTIKIADMANLLEFGDVIHKTAFSSMGERSSIGSTVQGEDLWEGSDTQLPIPAGAGEQMTIVSSSTADNGTTATGVLTLQIAYLDAMGIAQTEDIIVNGTTPVDTIATDITFVNDMYALTLGSNGVAAGTIIIYKKGAATTIYNRISIGGNKSLVINRKVPSSKTLFITGWTCTESIVKETSFRLRANCDPSGTTVVGGFLFKRIARVKGASFTEEINPPIEICSGAIVKISAWATGAGGAGSGSFNGYFVDI